MAGSAGDTNWSGLAAAVCSDCAAGDGAPLIPPIEQAARTAATEMAPTARKTNAVELNAAKRIAHLTTRLTTIIGDLKILFPIKKRKIN